MNWLIAVRKPYASVKHSMPIIPRSRWKPFVFYGSELAVLATLLSIILKLNHHRMEVPFIFEGDAMHHLMIAKAIISHGWWWHISNLAAPFGGLNMIEFPVGGTLDYSIMALLSVFIRSPGALLNIFWLFTVFAACVGGTWCLKRLRIPPPVAFALGILFAIIPHIYYRNVGHLMLVTYLVPFIGTWCVLLAAGRWRDLAPWERRIFIASCGLVGLDYIYTAFFSAFLLAIGGAIGFIRTRSRETIAKCAVSLGLLVCTAGANLTPTLIAWNRDPLTRDFMQGFKSPPEGEIFALKLRHLITPRQDHFIKPLREFQGRINQFEMPLDNENTFARLGMVASIGFLALLVISITGELAARGDWGEILRGLAAINLALFLFCTIGGFGALFNIFISPNIRCYNRASMFIAFFGFACVGVILARLPYFKPNPNCTKSCPMGYAILAVLVAFGAADQNTASEINANRAENFKRYDMQGEFVARIEKRLPIGASTYELPFTDYPNTPNLHDMRADDHIVAYLHSTRDDLKWSWPVISVKDHEWNRSLEALPTDALVEKLRQSGFSAIWLDRFGYKDKGAELETGLQRILGPPSEVSSNGQYAFYLINPS